MAIVYRPALEQDFAIAEALPFASINDLTERHAFGAMASPGPHPFLSFSLQDDPAGLWVAEEAGKMLGFAFSWVCGDLWFLAQLFISPDRQNQGIGHALITRTMDQARKSGVTTKALITFAFNRASQSLYIRHGIFPKLPLYFSQLRATPFGCRPNGCRARPCRRARLICARSTLSMSPCSASRAPSITAICCRTLRLTVCCSRRRTATASVMSM